MSELAIKLYYPIRSPKSLQREQTTPRKRRYKRATPSTGLEDIPEIENSIMKKILTAFLTLCLIPLYLHPAEEEKKEEDKSYLDRLKKIYDEKVESGKKLYDENVESGKKLYEKNLGSGKNISAQTKEWLMKDLENMGDWEYKIAAFGNKVPEEMEKELNQLGNERWQCFWVDNAGKQKVFYFKRTKMSFIQKIPAADLLRIIGFLNQE